jgi:O-antigen chain-terminating methyltransferase
MSTLSPTPAESSTIATLQRRADELRRKRWWIERVLRLAFPQQAKFEQLLLASLSALGKEAARDREALAAASRQTARLELLAASLRNTLRACETTICEQDQASAKNDGDALRRMLRLDQLAEETRSDLAALGRVQAGAADRVARIELLQASTSGTIQAEIAALQAQQAQSEQENIAQLASFSAQVAVLAAQVAEADSAIPSAEFAAKLNLLDQRLQALESERVAASPSHPGLGSFASRLLAVEGAMPALQRALAARTSALPSAADEAVATAESAFARFYLAFEDRYRGTRQEIASCQRIYLPYLETLGVLGAGQRTGARLADLGCGRGEWLQLLLEAGATGAFGVDRGAQMIDLCRQRGLPVEQSDALNFLRRQPDRSLAAITALHLVEHLPFPVLLAILGEARRVLETGGLLIMETPNCDNLLVASQSFHLDPTHRSPVPPLLLSFSVEHVGFREVTMLLLHPYSMEHRVADSSPLADRFNGFFYGPQDYAVVAHNA